MPSFPVFARRGEVKAEWTQRAGSLGRDAARPMGLASDEEYILIASEPPAVEQHLPPANHPARLRPLRLHFPAAHKNRKRRASPLNLARMLLALINFIVHEIRKYHCAFDCCSTTMAV